MTKKILLFTLICAGLAACQTLPTASEYLTRGDGFVKDGKIPQAIKAYNKALAMNPDLTAVYASRGAAYFFSGDYARAQEDFFAVVEKNPYQADGYTALGSALAARGDYQNAIKMFDISVRLNPRKPETFFSRAGVFLMLKEYDKAIADYTSVILLAPAADVYNARGAAYLQKGEQEKAQQDFDTAKKGTLPAKLNEYRMID